MKLVCRELTFNVGFILGITLEHQFIYHVLSVLRKEIFVIQMSFKFTRIFQLLRKQDHVKKHKNDKILILISALITDTKTNLRNLIWHISDAYCWTGGMGCIHEPKWEVQKNFLRTFSAIISPRGSHSWSWEHMSDILSVAPLKPRHHNSRRPLYVPNKKDHIPNTINRQIRRSQSKPQNKPLHYILGTF